jgi:hypothetical protein
LVFEGTNNDTTQASYTTTDIFVQMDDGTENNRLRLFGAVSTNQMSARMTNMSDLGTTRASNVFKLGLSARAGASTAALNGVAYATGTPTSMPTLTTLRIGSSSAGGGTLNGYARRIRYWPRLMPSTELVTVTT